MPRPEKRGAALFSWFILAAATLFVVLSVRIRLLDVPLERDEGEYAYAAQQWLQGVPPFESIYHMKLPGTYAAYMLILRLFGETTAGIHLGLLLLNLASGVLVFLIGRSLLDLRGGLIAATFFCIYTLSHSTQGFVANAEHFILLPALVGIFLLIRAMRSKQKPGRPVLGLWLAGLFLGIGAIMKQHGAFHLAFALVVVTQWCVAQRRGLRGTVNTVVLFTIAALLPFVVVCLVFDQLGLFDEFWWWTMEYPRHYGEHTTFEQAAGAFSAGIAPMLKGYWPAFVNTIAGFRSLAGTVDRNARIVLITLSVTSILAIAPGFHFHPHYFLLLAPGLALMTAVGLRAVMERWVEKASGKLRPYLVGIVVALLFGLPLLMERDYLFRWSPIEVSRNTYGPNPFPEAEELARYVAANSGPEDRIAIFGSEPQILFHAHRRSATGFLYLYEAMRDHPFARSFQETLMREVKEADPPIVLLVSIQPSWLSGPPSPTAAHLSEQVQAFIQERYDQQGIVDFTWPGPLYASFCWDAPGVDCAPKHDAWIGIYRRTGTD